MNWLRRLKIRMRILGYELWDWALGLMPTRCQRCEGVFFTKDTLPKQTTMGTWVDVCLPCCKILFPDEVD